MDDAREWWIDVMPEAEEFFDHEDSPIEIQDLEDEFGITRALAVWAVAVAFAVADGELAVNVFSEDLN